MSAIAGAKDDLSQVKQYARLTAQLENYCNLSILPYSVEAANRFQSLRKRHRRSSTPDLKIAAITMEYDGVLLTRNGRDFRHISGLNLDDWT